MPCRHSLSGEFYCVKERERGEREREHIKASWEKRGRERAREREMGGRE